MATAEVSPSDLRFRFQLNKQLPASITIHNPSGERLAFKVKTTTPKKYVVRPSSGVVEPRTTATVQVIMQVQKEFPADFSSCKDKFLVQVKPLAAGEAVGPDTFKSGEGVRDTKIRVVLEAPPSPPSPVPEVNELDESDSLRHGAGSGSLAAAGSLGGGDLSAENASLLRQVQKLTSERDRLQAQLKAGGGGGGSGGGLLSPGSLLPVLLVGVLAFLVGHFLHDSALLQQLLGGLKRG